MNKYLKAYKIVCKLTPIDFLLAKIRKSNKLVRLACEKAEKYDELNTPKKPRVEKVLWAMNSTSEQYIINHYCPNCNKPLNKFTHNYCNKCGIKIDWSDE